MPQVGRLIDCFEIASEEAVRLYGEYAPMDISPRNEGMQSVVRRFPIGVVSMISPFNFPLNLAAHKIAPAIAAGCPFVLKPASRTPLGALMIAECLANCEDMPKAAFSVVTCDRKVGRSVVCGAGPAARRARAHNGGARLRRMIRGLGALVRVLLRAQVGDLFVTDPRPKLLSFTGSPDVGWAMKERCGKKKCVLELGGNAACVLDSWDEGKQSLDSILDRICFGGYYQSGQSCIHLQRLFVRSDHYTEVKEKLTAKVKALKKGNPLQEDTFVGPLITEGDAVRIEKWVHDACAAGGKVLAGGQRFGHVYDATLVEGVPRTENLYVEEAFAPVVVIEPYSDFKSVIADVNDSKYGIHVGIYTTDLDKSVYAWEQAEVGGVVIGDVPSMRVDSQPYGGLKDSGIGREGIRYAIEDMTEPRILLMKDVGKL